MRYMNLHIIKRITILFILIITQTSCRTDKSKKIITNEMQNVHFVGRFDFSNKPKTWAPGAYIEYWFSGKYCSVEITDEPTDYGNNYIELIIDDMPVRRIKLKDSKNHIKIFNKGTNGIHHVLITKCTEAKIGSITFNKINCNKIIKSKKKNKKSLEFIGDSMTCGNGAMSKSSSDIKGSWYEQHTVYSSFGPCVARRKNADWVLTAASGFGLTRSCCGNTSTLPDIYNYTDLSFKTKIYDWKKQKPKAVFICLGQNDGFQSLKKYSKRLVNFVKRIRCGHPKTEIIILDSPMAKKKLKTHLDKCILDAVKKLNCNLNKKIHYYFFKKRYHHGRGFHPNINEHKEIANEIIAFIDSKEKLQKLFKD